MKNVIKLLLIFTILLSVTGCELDIFNKKEIEALKEENRKLQLVKLKMEANRSLILDEKQLLYTNKEKLAKIAMQKEQLKLDHAKELEALQLQNRLEQERLAIEQKNAEAQLLLDGKLAAAKDRQELKLYLIGVVALLLLIIAFFVYYYYKRKREDKLCAYRDNLDKYFRAKENETRVQIAEKILDTISSGNLAAEHEARLIEVFNADRKEQIEEESLQDTKLLEEQNRQSDIEDAIIIDEKK